MVQRVPYHQFTGNTVTIGTGTSRVVMGADSGNLKIQDSQSNTTIIEPGFGLQGSDKTDIVDNKANLTFPPTDIADSQLIFATASSELFMKSGGGYYRVAMVNTDPSISLDKTSVTISSHLNLDITYTVTEPEGTPTTVTITDDIPDSAVTTTHTTSNNHVRYVFDGTTTLSSKTITFTATDGVNTGTATCTVNTSYSEELHQPASTTRKLAMSFNGGGMGRSGDYTITTNTGSPQTLTYNNSGGTLNSGYVSGFSLTDNFQIDDLSGLNSGRNHTFICWYKGTQTGTSSYPQYQPTVGFFADLRGSCYLAFGLYGGKLYISGDSTYSTGSTTVADGNWRMCAFTYTTNDICEGYVDVSGTMTKEISNIDVSGSDSYNRVDYIGRGYGYSGSAGASALDAIQVYSGILTQTQLQAIYDKGK